MRLIETIALKAGINLRLLQYVWDGLAVLDGEITGVFGQTCGFGAEYCRQWGRTFHWKGSGGRMDYEARTSIGY